MSYDYYADGKSPTSTADTLFSYGYFDQAPKRNSESYGIADRGSQAIYRRESEDLDSNSNKRFHNLHYSLLSIYTGLRPTTLTMMATSWAVEFHLMVFLMKTWKKGMKKTKVDMTERLKTISSRRKPARFGKFYGSTSSNLKSPKSIIHTLITADRTELMSAKEPPRIPQSHQQPNQDQPAAPAPADIHTRIRLLVHQRVFQAPPQP